MTPDQYRTALSRLGLTQLEAAKLFEISLRTSQGYAAGKYRIPKAIEIVLVLLMTTPPAERLYNIISYAAKNRRSKDQRDN